MFQAISALCQHWAPARVMQLAGPERIAPSAFLGLGAKEWISICNGPNTLCDERGAIGVPRLMSDPYLIAYQATEISPTSSTGSSSDSV